MAPSKRTTAPPTRAAKVAKKEEPTKQATCADQQEPGCPEPVAAILDKLNTTTSEPVVAMLRAGMPYILTSKPEDRHAYQVSVLGIWDELVKEVDAKWICDFNAAEAHCSAIAEEKATRDEKLLQARDVEAKLLCKKQEAEASSRETDAARSEAAAVAAAQKRIVEEADAVLHAKIEARSGYGQALAETWEPLKANSFAGKDWRLRNKTIERLSSLLEMAAPSAALAASLPVALKTSLNARGPFTTQVIEAGEAAFQEHLQLMQTQEDLLRESRSAKSEALSKADDAAAAKAEAHDTAQQASIDAQNAWVEANSTVFVLENTKIEEKEAAAAAASQEARGTLDGFRGHVSAYELLVNPASPTGVDCTPVQMSDAAVTQGDVVMAADSEASAEVMAAGPARLEIPTDPVFPKVTEEIPNAMSTMGAACGA